MVMFLLKFESAARCLDTPSSSGRKVGFKRPALNPRKDLLSRSVHPSIVMTMSISRAPGHQASNLLLTCCLPTVITYSRLGSPSNMFHGPLASKTAVCSRASSFEAAITPPKKLFPLVCITMIMLGLTTGQNGPDHRLPFPYPHSYFK